MNYIVLDLEWNQAVTKEKVIRKPFPLHGEIIQIGAIKLDAQLQELETLKLLVKPRYYAKMNSAVKRLTGIRSRDLAQGLDFPTAVERFQNWCGSDVCFLTWGNDDTAMLMDNLKLYQLDVTWIPATYNLQRIFNEQITQQKRQWSLSGAMERLEIPQQNRAHDALNDALNTAAIVRALDLERGIREYGSDLMEKQDGSCLRSQRYGGYTSRGEALQDDRLRLVSCPVCGQIMEGNGWLPQGRNREIALFRCPDHGEFMAKLRIKRLSDGNFSAKSMLFALDSEGKARYMERFAQRQAIQAELS